jgi:hypothetical protein
VKYKDTRSAAERLRGSWRELTYWLRPAGVTTPAGLADDAGPGQEPAAPIGAKDWTPPPAGPLTRCGLCSVKSAGLDWLGRCWQCVDNARTIDAYTPGPKAPAVVDEPVRPVHVAAGPLAAPGSHRRAASELPPGPAEVFLAPCGADSGVWQSVGRMGVAA